MQTVIHRIAPLRGWSLSGPAADGASAGPNGHRLGHGGFRAILRPLRPRAGRCSRPRCSLGANALWPGEEATFTFFVKPGQPYKGPLQGGRDSVRHQGQARRLVEAGGLQDRRHQFHLTVDVDLPAEGGFVTVKPRIGDAFGGYALILDLGERGRAFGGHLRSRARAGAGTRLAADVRDGPGLAARDVAGGVQCLQAARREGRPHRRRLQHHSRRARGLGDGERPDAAAHRGLRRHAARAAAARARAALAERGRRDEGEASRRTSPGCRPSIPSSNAISRSVLMEHGWPKGPINAVELWNEPWEGVSISGWGADCLRYREIYQVMAEAVLEARQEAGREGAHRRRLFLGQHARQALLRRHRHVPAVAGFREHPLPAAGRRSRARTEVDEPPGRIRPGAGVGHRELGGQLRRPRRRRDRLDARHGPGPHRGHLRRQRVHLAEAPHRRQGIRRGAGLGAGRGGGGLPEVHRPARLQGNPVQERIAVGVCLRRIARAGGRRTDGSGRIPTTARWSSSATSAPATTRTARCFARWAWRRTRRWNSRMAAAGSSCTISTATRCRRRTARSRCR